MFPLKCVELIALCHFCFPTNHGYGKWLRKWRPNSSSRAWFPLPWLWEEEYFLKIWELNLRHFYRHELVDFFPGSLGKPIWIYWELMLRKQKGSNTNDWELSISIFEKHDVVHFSPTGGRKNELQHYTPPLAKVQGGRGGLKYNTGFVLFCLWISPSMHIHIYMYMYIYMYIFFEIIFIQ